MGYFDTKAEAVEHMESFAKGDPVSVYQVGGTMTHYGVVSKASKTRNAEIFGGDYSVMEIKLKQGGNEFMLTDKMMVDGSWIINYVGVEDRVEEPEAPELLEA